MELTEKYFMEMAGWKAMKEARALLESRKVLSASWKPPLLKGTVEAGGRVYSCGFNIPNPSGIENICTCKESREWGTLCAHSVAVGLEIIRKQKFKDGELAPKTKRVTSNKNNISSNRENQQKKSNPTRIINRVENPEGSSPLEIHLMLAPNWNTQLLQQKPVSVTLKACIPSESEELKPLGSINKNENWFLDEADHNLVRGLEELEISELPSHLSLPSQSFFQWCQHLSGHQNIHIIKGDKLEIKADPWIPKCKLEAHEDGSLTLTQTPDSESQPEILMGPPAWVHINDSLRPISPAATQWDWNQSSHKIPRGKISQFLATQWPDLEATHQVESHIDPDLFDIQPGKGIFHLTLEGGLATLKGRLRCQYGRSFHSIGFKEKKLSLGEKAQWIADPENPFRYFTRDFKLEAKAVSMLQEAGFYALGDEEIELKSQDCVLPFFATVYPKLQKIGWNIELESRLNNSLNQKTERVEPNLEFMSSGEDWFELNLQYGGTQGSKFSESEVRELLRSGKSYRKKTNGKILLIDTPLLEEFQEVIRDCDPTQKNNKYSIDKNKASFLVDTIEESTNWKTNGINNLVSPPPENLFNPGKDLAKTLRDYQLKGAKWLTDLEFNKLGGILADDMGLGKTIQTLAFISSLKSRLKESWTPSLIICPTSLVHNWVDEAVKFTPELKVLAIHGPKRSEMMKDMAKSDVIITSIPLIHRDIQNYTQLSFSSLFVDEAQNIKNAESKAAKAVRQIPSSFRCALSGTPVENRIMDMWSLVDFIMPGYLGPKKEFHSRYEVPIAKLKDQSVADRLRRRIKPFILRRLKSDVVKELPDKIDKVHFCDMTREQAQFYQSILESSRNKIYDSVNKSGFAKNQFLIFQTLMRLRQICCDLRLLSDAPEMNSISTGKFELFQEILDEAIDSGHKVLVFSQFTSMLSLLQEKADEKAIGYCSLHGGTRNRPKVIQEFRDNQSKKAFFISLKAGGTGLNLTEADIVIHYDPWWNPAVEDQATSRAHRIGQKSVVTSYKLITRNTIEEKILHLQEKKRSLFKSMVDESAKLADNLSWNEVQDLLDDSSL